LSLLVDVELERDKLEAENEALQKVRNGLLWLNNNLANYGSQDFLAYLRAAIQDALLTKDE
ncbi:unnamed protein product, partial [marine sediment metagenome]